MSVPSSHVTSSRGLLAALPELYREEGAPDVVALSSGFDAEVRRLDARRRETEAALGSPAGVLAAAIGSMEPSARTCAGGTGLEVKRAWRVGETEPSVWPGVRLERLERRVWRVRSTTTRRVAVVAWPRSAWPADGLVAPDLSSVSLPVGVTVQLLVLEKEPAPTSVPVDGAELRGQVLAELTTEAR